jgi:predicted phage terminase large subunit-like protein
MRPPTPAEIEVAKRALAGRDPNALIERVLHVRQAEVHRRIQAHLTGHDQAYVEAHRGIGKTSQCAGRLAFEIGTVPGIRIKYVAQTDEEAGKTVATCKRIVESREYRDVFPWVQPDPEVWGKMAFRVKAERIRRDPTLEASGIFGHAGGRWDLLVGDDVCDMKNAIQSASLRKQVIEAWANTWLPMADPSSPSPPRVWCFGTPFHASDITAGWRRRHGAAGSLLSLPVVDGVSPWPEAFTPEVLAAKRAEMDSATAYARAYELKPLAEGDQPIPAEIIRFWTQTDEIPEGGSNFMGVDPAISEKTTADFSAICEAVYKAPKLYVVGLHRGRWGGSQLKASIRARAEAFQPRKMAVESVQFQKLLVDDLLETHPYPITPVVPSGDPIGHDKRSRAEWLAIHLANGNILLRGEPGTGLVHATQQALYDELTGYPVAEHDDCMDALFYAARAALKTGSAKVGW